MLEKKKKKEFDSIKKSLKEKKKDSITITIQT